MEDSQLNSNIRDVVNVVVEEDNAVMLNRLIDVGIKLSLPSVAKLVVGVKRLEDFDCGQAVGHSVNHRNGVSVLLTVTLDEVQV